MQMKGNRSLILGILFKSHQDLERLTQETNVIKFSIRQEENGPKELVLGVTLEPSSEEHSSQRVHTGECRKYQKFTNTGVYYLTRYWGD